MAKFKLFGLRTDDESQREKQHRQLCREVAGEGIVLLKNEGVLPLRNKKIALFGAGARMTVKGGTGSGDMQERYSVSIEQGLRNAGFEIVSTRWLDRFDQYYAQKDKIWRQSIEEKIKAYKPWQVQKMFDEVIHVNPLCFPCGDKIQIEDLSADTDTAIYVVARQAGESADRRFENGDFKLSEEESYNIHSLAEQYEKLLLVINCGGILDLSILNETNNIGAVLYYVQGGEEGGNAFADIVSGKINPSGKITDTWAKRYEDYPSAMDYGYLNGNLKDEDYKEGIYVGYRYFDSFGINPLFEFGFGLSYTTFSHHVSDIHIQKTKVTIKVMITNTGTEFSGKQVLQLYLEKPNGRLCHELRSLVAFVKTKNLKPDENELLTLTFDLCDHASYDEKDSNWVLDQGEYGICLGTSSRQNEPVAVVVLENETVVEKCTSICPMEYDFSELKAEFPIHEYDLNLPRFEVRSDDISYVKHVYENPKIKTNLKTEQLLLNLNDKELIELIVGAGYSGKSFNNTPGCAGRTTVSLLKKSIPNVNFSDGPAGLNLTPKIVILKSGSMRYIDGIPAMWKWGWLKKIEPFVKAKAGRGTPVYQFMTAWPAVTLQAQTWNLPLIEKVGNAVGVEMIETGVTLWLAPGMNIHRNPLCGRNFEYYSEDPILTGMMSSAVSKGVQSHKGIGVTVKHFCCNNQEDNREYVSANIKERALREIYLKGFRYAVEHSNPKAVMSSYNLVNGVYTANSFDLLTKVLRCEWGYDGMTMTDWNSTENDKGKHELCPVCGTDLIMPGSKAAKKALLKGLKNDSINRDDILRCAANVLNMIFESAVIEGF